MKWDELVSSLITGASSSKPGVRALISTFSWLILGLIVEAVHTGYGTRDTTTVILLYFGGWFAAVFLIGELLILVYKGLIFPYPTGNFVSEIFLLIFILCIETIRTFLGKKGNLTERPLSVAVSVGLTAPAVIGVIYFLLWQTYVLRIELIMCGIQLTFQGGESLLGLIAMLTFAKTPSSYG